MIPFILSLLCCVVGILGQQSFVGPYPLNPGDLASSDYYGYSLAFGSRNGNPYVLVGAPANGGTGAVYEWQRYSLNNWQLTQKIVPPDFAYSFGLSITFAGDLLAIGAPASNRVYIFGRNSTGQWSWITTLTNSASGFGSSLSSTIQGGDIHLAVGAPFGSPGRVFVYVNQGSVWNLVLNYTDGNNNFGETLAFGGSDNLLVGSPSANTSRGAVLHFEYSSNTWNYVTTLTSPNLQTFSYFGVGMFGERNNDYWLVGSYGNSGPVQVLTRSGGSLTITNSITRPDMMFNYFGFSISYDSNSRLAVIGAYIDSTNATNSGAVYVYDGTTFLQKITLYNTSNAYFGWSVAVSGQIFVVGACGQNNFQGAAYVYEVGSMTTTTTATSVSPVNIVPVPPAPPVRPPVVPPSPPPVSPPSTTTSTTTSTTSSTPTTPTRPPFGFLSKATQVHVVTPLLALFILLTLFLII